jgi:(p)ppGpp synthase/HD superfamily hydrolase
MSDEQLKREFDKSAAAMRHWLLGRVSASRFESHAPTPWALALNAFEFALQTHIGKRKDGSPEMIHQIRIAHYLRTLEGHLVDAPMSIASAMLHDIREDYGISHEEISTRFGQPLAGTIELLTKSFRGRKKDEKDYYLMLTSDPVASIVKAADRFHNHSSMGNAFSVAKQLSYLVETEQLVLPMIKVSARAFPLQEPAFENAKLALRSQISLARPALLLAEKLAAAHTAQADARASIKP